MPTWSQIFTLTGKNHLLMDRDNLDWASTVKKWQVDPENRDLSMAGDDRSPAWLWLGKLHYVEGAEGWVIIPTNWLLSCLRNAGAAIKHPTSKGTLKAATQASLLLPRLVSPLLVQMGKGETRGWHPISYDMLHKQLEKELDFEVHKAVVQDAGFRLDVRRASPQYNTKHVRVRPMFGPWRCLVELTVMDTKVFNPPLLDTLWEYAGTYKGLGNWRPSVGKAGTYGTFDVMRGIPADLKDVAKDLDYIA